MYRIPVKHGKCLRSHDFAAHIHVSKSPICVLARHSSHLPTWAEDPTCISQVQVQTGTKITKWTVNSTQWCVKYTSRYIKYINGIRWNQKNNSSLLVLASPCLVPLVVFSCKDEKKLESEFRETTASWNTISTDSYVNLHRRTQPTACRIYMRRTLQSSRESRRSRRHSKQIAKGLWKY